jgi:hypothetical protein
VKRIALLNSDRKTDIRPTPVGQWTVNSDQRSSKNQFHQFLNFSMSKFINSWIPQCPNSSIQFLNYSIKSFGPAKRQRLRSDQWTVSSEQKETKPSAAESNESLGPQIRQFLSSD